MAKRRQQDFNKTQMKPGRTVAKRKNVTNTSFKAKKLTMPATKGPKEKSLSSKTIEDCLRVLKSNSQINTKAGALNDLNKLINLKKSSLSPHLTDVLDAVLTSFLDVDETMRKCSMGVFENILACTNDLQLQSFIPLIVNVLSCAMTNTNAKIKDSSLTLVTAIIKQHPNLICSSSTILNNLLRLLFDSPRTRIHCPKQKVQVLYNDGICSANVRVHLFGIINAFLTEMLKKKEDIKTENRVEQEVYWDSESPMHLEVYAEGGLKPFDIEKSYSPCIVDSEFSNDSEILIAIDGILQILPAAFIEEVVAVSKSDDHLLDSNQIHNLNILFKCLRSISNWLRILPSEDLDRAIRKFLKESVYDKELFPFGKRAVVGKEEQAIESVELNLSVCLLYSTYLLESEKNKEHFYRCIFTYIERVFKMGSEVKFIPILISIMKMYFGVREIPEVADFLVNSLIHLCSLLQNCDSMNRDLLTSLFTKMSLDSAYNFIAETDVMLNWYKWLLNRLIEIPKTGKVDKKLLGIIKKIANRRYPCFQKLLMAVDFPAIRALLKYDDDDVRDTTIFLIYNMAYIDSDMLDSIARIILTDSTFPRKFAIRLIRLLTYRYSEKPRNGEIPEVSIYTPKGLINIVQFLLNIAIDSFNISKKKFIDFEANEYTQAVKILKDVTSYSVLPSLYWKEHSILFEVCTRFLNTLPPKVVNCIAVKMFKEILDISSVLPMHTVIAILKLNKKEMEEKYYGVQINDLIFTSLLTTSILTRMSMDNDWYECNVIELTDSIKLNSQTALETLHQIEVFKDDGLEGIVAYHILRVCKFYLEREVLQTHDDFQSVLRTMEILKEKCSDKTIGQQPLFITLNRHFFSYYSM